MNSEELYHTLHDISSSGKEVNWVGKKQNTFLFAESMQRSGLIKRAVRMKECGTELTFVEKVSGGLKLHDANFCKDRMCPMCIWRRSLKQFGQTSKLMDYIKSKQQVRYVFLTLTIENCVGDELGNAVKMLINGFSLLLRRKEVKKSILGACRHLEVTYHYDKCNKSFNNKFHPHIHAILMVKPSYFARGDYYISQARWTEMWADCIKVDYNPIVHIETVKKSEQEKSVAELSKYPVKMQNLIDLGKSGVQSVFDYAVNTLAIQLANVRLIEYYGLMRKYRQELKLEDVENGDLVSNDIQDMNEELTGVIFRYQWRNGLYMQVDNF